jgi:hypothetical protein
MPHEVGGLRARRGLISSVAVNDGVMSFYGRAKLTIWSNVRARLFFTCFLCRHVEKDDASSANLLLVRSFLCVYMFLID